jgi:Fe2+ or Zn2+ uptake regulation protein
MKAKATTPLPADASRSGGLALGPAFRLTRQRREVYEVVGHGERDHPTAADVFQRVKDRVPGISLATVYNCLETLVGNGLLKQVTLDRGPSRYCANLVEHAHFHCESCGVVSDVSYPASPQTMFALPRGAKISRFEVSLRGLCPNCARTAKQAGLRATASLS